jgi:hypothetical protein
MQTDRKPTNCKARPTCRVLDVHLSERQQCVEERADGAVVSREGDRVHEVRQRRGVQRQEREDAAAVEGQLARQRQGGVHGMAQQPGGAGEHEEVLEAEQPRPPEQLRHLALQEGGPLLEEGRQVPGGGGADGRAGGEGGRQDREAAEEPAGDRDCSAQGCSA